MNRGGHRPLKNVLKHWKGAPTSLGAWTCIHVPKPPHAQHVSISIAVPARVRVDILRDLQRLETGSMSQVFQGNNLRYLFTETPSSLQQTYLRMSCSSLSSFNGSNPLPTITTRHSPSTAATRVPRLVSSQPQPRLWVSSCPHRMDVALRSTRRTHWRQRTAC
jgi:hypothetical protein